MLSVGDQAPEFSAPHVSSTIDTTTLTELLADGPVMLAFFPGAFTGTCTSEMKTLSDQFETAPVRVVGISRDLPFALSEFRRGEQLAIDLVSDVDGELIEQYDVVDTFADIGVERIANRAVFLVDETGTVTYRWVSDDPSLEPPYEDLETAIDTL